jgi:hypothetical protein
MTWLTRIRLAVRLALAALDVALVVVKLARFAYLAAAII